jgi:hypothetical protein
MSEQIEKIQKLIKTATNPKQKAMYQDLLAKLQSELSENAESTDTPQEHSSPSLIPKPKRTSSSSPVSPPKPLSVKPQKVKKVETVSPTNRQEKLTPETVNEDLKSEPESSDDQEVKETDSQTETEPSESEDERRYFQGIGIISGVVTLTEERSTVTLGDKEYRLFYIPNRRRKAYDALKKEIETTGNTTQKLIVYPKILHFPSRDQPHQVAFQLVGFVGHGASSSPLNTELNDFEFKFSGLWQFIPVCRTPCITVMRNFSQDRLAWIKEAEAAKKVKFMKASHVPLLWRDSPVKPFRFNPRLEKDQQCQTYFVQVKAKFLPGRDVFGFVEQLNEPTEEAPGFLKASKKLKAEALRETKERKQQKQVEVKENVDHKSESSDS